MKKILKFFRVKEQSDIWISIATIFLALFGLVMAISASMTTASNSSKILIVTTIKQFVYFAAGYGGMVFASKHFSFKKIKNLIFPISIIMLGLLLSTLFFKEVNGAQAWIRLKPGGIAFTIQPSEFAKLTSILLAAVFVGDVSLNTQRSGTEILKKPLYIIFIQAFIILILQSDLGSAIVFLLIMAMVLLIPAHPKIKIHQNIVIILFILGLVGTTFLLTDKGLALIESVGIFKGYKLARFMDYANPFLNRTAGGFQLAGSLVAFSRGSIFGSGLGHSIQKYGYLPEASTDFILSLIAEETGFVGVMLVMILYFILIYRLIYFAMKVRSEKDKMVLFGTAAFLFVHILFNVGGITATIPLTGVPLLLLSSGGSSTMAIMLAIGISQNIISKHKIRMQVNR